MWVFLVFQYTYLNSNHILNVFTSDQCPTTAGGLDAKRIDGSQDSWLLSAKTDNVFIFGQLLNCKMFGMNIIADGAGKITVATFNKSWTRTYEMKSEMDYFVTTGLNIIAFDKPRQENTVAIQASSTVITPGEGTTNVVFYPKSSVTKGSKEFFGSRASRSGQTTVKVMGIFQGMNILAFILRCLVRLAYF